MERLWDCIVGVHTSCQNLLTPESDENNKRRIYKILIIPPPLLPVAAISNTSNLSTLQLVLGTARPPSSQGRVDGEMSGAKSRPMR